MAKVRAFRLQFSEIAEIRRPQQLWLVYLSRLGRGIVEDRLPGRRA
jgi:hypothetical protein